MNKKQSAIYHAYIRSDKYRLEDCYARYSTAKSHAWDYCVNLMMKFDGWGLKVVSYNGWVFTAGFEYADPETGVISFMYITPSKDEHWEVVE